mgnify:FL=1
MCKLRNIYLSLFLIFFFNNAQSFTDNSGKGAQSTGREDLSFLDVKSSDLKKGKDSLKRALKFEKKNKNKKANKYFERALKYFVSANKENADNIEILNHLGFTYNKIGDLIMSEIYYQQGLVIDPKNNLINLRLGELYIYTKRNELAKERLKVLSKCNCQEYSDLKNIITSSK